MKDIEQVQKPSVLLIAYGCEPDASSEPGVGWNFAREISTFCRVHVITRSNNQGRIERALGEEASMSDNITWHYVDIPPLAKLKNRIPLGIQIYYALWQWKATFLGMRLKRSHRIDLCHHLTYGVMWLSPITAFIMKPFIWGPIGGGDTIPWAFRRHLRLKDLLQESTYALMSYLIPRLSPIAIMARSRARAIIFRTNSTKSHFPSKCEHTFTLCETALPDKPLPARNEHSGLNIVCIGRQTYWKNYTLAIRGFHRALHSGANVRLTFLGSGPELDNIRRYINRYDLEDLVKAPGHVPYEEGQEILSRADVLLHPSFRDGGSWAVLEAMQQGRPIICLNHSGLADMVDDDSGIRIVPKSPEQVVDAIRDAILTLDRDRTYLEELSRGARKRVETHYRWDKRREQIRSIYTHCLPEFNWSRD